ncbi:RPEL repeat-containing protein [Aspergillus lucknowensis]|uniref:RPEL repeat protein n=1 Tax=Aspergillus lucknowensis TaxID=176173 RepID=A0ABR4LIZ1_9EURO
MSTDNSNPPVDTTPSVDTTSLTSSPIERRDSLEKHLLTRPDPQDLKDRHILLDTNVAPSIQAMRQKLDRQRVSDSLKKNLEHRPEREELVDRHILLGDEQAPISQ